MAFRKPVLQIVLSILLGAILKRGDIDGLYAPSRGFVKPAV